MIALGLLLALVVYYYLAKFTVKTVGKYYPGKLARYLTIAVFVLIPLWDAILGNLYFYYLCAMESGQQVYKTVELPREYFLKAGEPDPRKAGRPAVGGELNRPKVPERYQFSNQGQQLPFRVMGDAHFIKDKETGEVLGTATIFRYFGGWLINRTGVHFTASQCPKLDPHERFIADTLPEKVFRPVNADSGKVN